MRDLMPKNWHVSATLYLPSGLTSGLTAVIILQLANVGRVLAHDVGVDTEGEEQSGCEKMSGIAEDRHDRES